MSTVSDLVLRRMSYPQSSSLKSHLFTVLSSLVNSTRDRFMGAPLCVTPCWSGQVGLSGGRVESSGLSLVEGAGADILLVALFVLGTLATS